MITSMTGFASVTREDEWATVGVTLRSVNHRYLDLQVRAPQPLAPFEATLRGLVQRRLTRGRVELSIALVSRRPASVQVEVNGPLLVALGSALDEARTQGLVSGTLALGDLLRLPQALTIREQPQPESDGERARLAALVEQCVEAALTELNTMRAHEGRALHVDLEGRRKGLATSLDRVAAEATIGNADLRGRLGARIDELGAGGLCDGSLIAQEIVRFAARSDISEELVRFRAHLAHWQSLSDGPEPCGRKLEFLLQEMNREINTIGSKAEGLKVGELIVHVKAELEKMREQVQNVE